MPTTERSINDAIALVLRERRRLWAAPQRVRSENTRIFRDAGLQPDILITEPGTTPVVVETEVLPAVTVEADARSRLGQACGTPDARFSLRSRCAFRQRCANTRAQP